MARDRIIEDLINAILVAHKANDVDALMRAAMSAIFELTKARKAQEELRARRATDSERTKARRHRAGGDVPPSVRFHVLQRDAFACVACGSKAADGAKLQMDHVTPISRGGRSIAENLQTLCDLCNSGKSDG